MITKVKKPEKSTKSWKEEESELEKEVEQEAEEVEKTEEESESQEGGSEAEGESEDGETEQQEKTISSSIVEIGVIRSAEAPVESADEAAEGASLESSFSARAIDIPSSSLPLGEQQLEQEVAETPVSVERREQAERIPERGYAAASRGYERVYSAEGEQRKAKPMDIEMGIMRVMPRRDIREMVDTDSTRRIDIQEWQRSMNIMQETRAERAPVTEEYMVDVRRENQERRLPFEKKERKREYSPIVEWR